MKKMINSLNKKQRLILFSCVIAVIIIIVLRILWNIGLEKGIIDVSILPVVFTILFFFIIPFIVVTFLAVIFAKKYFEKKNILTLYEKTFGLINDEEYDISVYQNYLEEDN